MASEREELTDYERVALCNGMLGRSTIGVRVKALRIIDAHAADRAALVAQLEAANGLLHRALDKDPMVRRDIRVFFKQPGIVPPAHAALAAQVAELTRERDEAKRDARECGDHWKAECEITARLTRERDEALKLAVDGTGHIARLTEALAAAESTIERWKEGRGSTEARVRELEADNANLRQTIANDTRAIAAESECAALRAELERLRETDVHRARVWERTESRLAAANALLCRVQLWRPPADQDPSTYDAGQRKTLQLTEDILAHLAAQPATQEKKP